MLATYGTTMSYKYVLTDRLPDQTGM